MRLSPSATREPGQAPGENGEKTLLSLKRATLSAARSIMEAPGMSLSNRLHYLSNHLEDDGGYSGDLNLTFDGGGKVSS